MVAIMLNTRRSSELANAYAAPEASYQTLAAADVIARNRT